MYTFVNFQEGVWTPCSPPLDQRMQKEVFESFNLKRQKTKMQAKLPSMPNHTAITYSEQFLTSLTSKIIMNGIPKKACAGSYSI